MKGDRGIEGIRGLDGKPGLKGKFQTIEHIFKRFDEIFSFHRNREQVNLVEVA